jgi:hypothetical protein
MGSLVHTGLGSSSLVAHVLPYPPPPPRQQLCTRSCSNKHTHTFKPNQCPCLMRTLPCVAICRNTTIRRAARNHASLSPLPRQCGVRWAAHGRQTAALRLALRSQSRKRTMLLSCISSSGSPTNLPSLLVRMCHAAARGTSWVGCLGPRQLLPPPCFELDLRARPCLAGVGEHLKRSQFRHQSQAGAHECGQPPRRSRNPQHPRGAADRFAGRRCLHSFHSTRGIVLD